MKRVLFLAVLAIISAYVSAASYTAYVVNDGQGIWKIDLDKETKESSYFVSGDISHDIACDSDYIYYKVDGGSSPDKIYRKSVTNTTIPAEEMVAISGLNDAIATDGSGNVYVMTGSPNRITKISAAKSTTQYTNLLENDSNWLFYKSGYLYQAGDSQRVRRISDNPSTGQDETFATLPQDSAKNIFYHNAFYVTTGGDSDEKVYKISNTGTPTETAYAGVKAGTYVAGKFRFYYTKSDGKLYKTNSMSSTTFNQEVVTGLGSPQGICVVKTSGAFSVQGSLFVMAACIAAAFMALF